MHASVLSRCAVGALLLLMGCGGGGGGSQLKTVSAKGTVTIDGKPFGPGTLSFLPQEKDANKRKAATGRVEDDGKFSVSSYGKSDGAVPGEYAVLATVDLGKGQSPNTEPLKITIGEKGEDNLSIALKSKKGPGDLLSPTLNDRGAGTSLKRP